jgi:hypothetical protein
MLPTLEIRGGGWHWRRDSVSFIAEGWARESGIVSCFDGSKPSGWDWFTGRGMVEQDKSADAVEVMRIIGLRGCHGGGLERRCSCGWREVLEVSTKGSGA